MIVSRKPSLIPLLRWQWKLELLYTSSSILMIFIHNYIFQFHVNFQSFPLAVMGGALGIFVSFRTN